MRNLKTLALAGVIGVFALASDASACHKKKCACPAPAPVVVCAPAPVVECAPAKKCHFKMPKMPKMGCHKSAPVCAPVAYSAPASYAPATYASPQASAQASGQGM